MCRIVTLFRTLAFLLLLAGCQYENHDKYFDPVEPPDGTDASLTLQQLEGSVIYRPVLVNMKVMPSGKEQYEARIKAGLVTLYNLTSSTGDFSFILDPAKFANGQNTLNVEVILGSIPAV